MGPSWFWDRVCGVLLQGEDPTLNSEYGSMFIAGFQGDAIPPANGSAPPPLKQLKASACAKHFFACACVGVLFLPCVGAPACRVDYR